MTGGDWRFAEAEESHEVSLSADSRYQLTGEAAGRQIWHQDQQEGQQQEKTFRFNAAENPNSSDQLFRAQMLDQWAAAGKAVPDPESSPESAKQAAVKGLEFYQMLQCDDGHWAGDYGGMQLALTYTHTY
jgi:lanosterol synthase